MTWPRTLRPEQNLKTFISIEEVKRRVIPIWGMMGRGLRVRGGKRRFQMWGARVDWCWGRDSWSFLEFLMVMEVHGQLNM